MPWNGLRREMGEPAALEVFRKCVDVALKDTGSGDGLALGLEDLGGLFQR